MARREVTRGPGWTLWNLAFIAWADVGRGFSEFDYMRTPGPFCPDALQLWFFRVPYGSGVPKCGEGTLDGPELPPRPTAPPVTSTTTRTRVTTIPGFQEEIEATCCTTLPPPSTAIPKYTTPAPYEYVWDTTTLTKTTTTSSSTTSSSTTVTTATTSSFSTTSTNSKPWWWNPDYFSTTWTSTLTTTSLTMTTDTTTTLTSTMSSTTTDPRTSTDTTTQTFTQTETNTTTGTTSSTQTTSSTSYTTTSTTSWTNTSSTVSTTYTTSTTLSSTTTTASFLPDPPISCKPLCPRLTPTACRDELPSDAVCETTMLNSPCFEQSNLVFSCPGTNHDPTRYQDFVSGHYGVKCWICSFASSTIENGLLADVDLRTGYVLVDLKFGPNMLGNTLDEGPLDGYAIFMTDLAGERISNTPVGSVAKKFGSALARDGCCEADAYSARITVRLPEGREQVRFEVVPILTGLGPLAVGRISVPVVDASPYNQVVTPSASHQVACPTMLVIALLAITY